MSFSITISTSSTSASISSSSKNLHFEGGRTNLLLTPRDQIFLPDSFIQSKSPSVGRAFACIAYDVAPSNTMPGPTLASVLGAADNDDGKATVDNQSDSSLTPLGNLITLPPELRLMIYEHLIKSGSVIFLRTSSAVYNEAANTLYNQGVCNLELNVYRLPLVYPTAAAANKISNLQVRVNLTDKSQERNERCVYLFHIFEPFRQSLVPRKTCKILLDCHPSFVAHIPPQAFEIIGTLTGFETLILAIANDTEDCTTRVRSLMYSAKPDPRRQMDLALHGEVNENTLRAYEIAKVYLEGTLGPSKWVCDERGAHLEFHPRGFLSDDRSHQQGKLKTPLEWNG